MSTVTPCPVHPRVSDPSMRPAEEKPDTVIDIDEPIEKPQTQTNLEKVKGLFTSAWENKLIVFIIVLIVLIVGIIAYMLNKKSDTGEKSSIMDKIKNGFNSDKGKKPGGEQVAQYGGNAGQQQTQVSAQSTSAPRTNTEQTQAAQRRQPPPSAQPQQQTQSSQASPVLSRRQETTSSNQTSPTAITQTSPKISPTASQAQSSPKASDHDESGQPSHDTFMSMSADELQNLKKQRAATAAVAAAMAPTPPKPAVNNNTTTDDLNDYLKNEAMKPVADGDSDADLNDKPIIGPNPVEKNIISEIDAAIAPNFAAPMDAQAIDTNKAMIDSMTTPSTTAAAASTMPSADGKCTQLLSTGRYCKNAATKGNKCHHHA